MTRLFSNILSKGSPKRIVSTFGDEHGLVYFGNVDQHDDEHQIVKGMTVSHTHTDEHYSVGTYNDYDVSFVQRHDTITTPNGKKRNHTWQIMQCDLKTSEDLPHLFIGLHSHSESFYTHLFTKYSHMRPIQLGAIHPHSADFLGHYRVYGSIANHISIEQLLPSALDDIFLKHFRSLAIEITDESLFVYSEQPLSANLLEVMIKNMTWLAGHIDATKLT